MNLRIAAVRLLLAGSLTGLGGCGWLHTHDGHERHLAERLHQRPLVHVKAGLLSVSPEPVVLQAGAGDRSIAWQLPAPALFEGAGIVVLGRLVDARGEPVPPTQKALETPGLKIDGTQREAFACRVSEDRRQVSCTSSGKPGARGVYKYQIRVLHEGKTLLWDPNILHLD